MTVNFYCCLASAFGLLVPPFVLLVLCYHIILKNFGGGVFLYVVNLQANSANLRVWEERFAQSLYGQWEWRGRVCSSNKETWKGEKGILCGAADFWNLESSCLSSLFITSFINVLWGIGQALLTGVVAAVSNFPCWQDQRTDSPPDKMGWIRGGTICNLWPDWLLAAFHTKTHKEDLPHSQFSELWFDIFSRNKWFPIPKAKYSVSLTTLVFFF